MAARILVCTAASVALVVAAGCARSDGGAVPTARPPAGWPPVPNATWSASVVRVVDGDTLIARVGRAGRPVRVRLIGVDTPESVRPHTPLRCYALEAAALTKRLLPVGATVRAAYEPGGRRDRYGRELWDVWLPDRRQVQAVLVAAGAARAYPYPPQLRYAPLLRRLAAAARARRSGLWGPPCRGNSFGRTGPG